MTSVGSRLRRQLAPVAKTLLLRTGGYRAIRTLAPSRQIAILRYHAVCGPEGYDYADPGICVSPEAFDAHVAYLSSQYTVLPLPEAVDRLRQHRALPPNAVAITFDDGYADNEEVAAPILQRLGLSATFFVSTGYWDGSCMWNDRLIEAIRTSTRSELDLRASGLGCYAIGSLETRRAAIVTVRRDIRHLPQGRREEQTQAIVAASGSNEPTALMMPPQQVRKLRARGMDIGAHTMTHPILTRLDAATARHEIASSKRQLEELLDEPVDLFAYPNGVPQEDYTSEHVGIVRDSGFKAAVSTAWGAASARSDRFQLPRFTPWDRARWRYGIRLLANLQRREQVAA
jgi:peptidoglycan/xylan/chitin deacetylase (PgdA/CDA1 family)